MRRNVERMGEHLLLTSREMDVLTLYSRWVTHTVSRAKELFITPATAHSHIGKRIYSKLRHALAPGKSSSTSILGKLRPNVEEKRPKPRIVPASRSRRNARAPHRSRSLTCAGSAFSAPSWPPSARRLAIGYKPQRRPRGDPRRSHRRQRRLLLARPPQA